MEILVDELPAHPKDCIFSRPDWEYHFICTLRDGHENPVCYFVREEACPFLKKFDDSVDYVKDTDDYVKYPLSGGW